jgi:hypothetical protein
MNKVLLLFITLSVFVPQQLSAQFTYMVDQSIPVQINEQTLSMPWGGGLNAVQYNTIDLNGDGLEDVAVFDRIGHKIITYLRQNGQYVYAPEYEA